MDEAGAIACCLCIGLPVFIWLITMAFIYVPQSHMPRCYIDDFYVRQLSTNLPDHDHQSTNPPITFISFDLELKNTMSEVGIHYQNIHLAFYYGLDPVFSVANYTVPGFYQGHGKTAYRRDVVEMRGLTWSDAFATVSNGSYAVFKVELTTIVKMKHWAWYGKSKRLTLGATIQVNGSGQKVRNKGIRLSSMPTRVPHNSVTASAPTNLVAFM